MATIKHAITEENEIIAFAANVTHDLRNPIAGIKTTAESLQNRITSPDDKRLLQNIVKTTTQLSSLIDHILVMSKEATQKPIVSYFSLQELITDVIDMVSLSAEAKNLKLLMDCNEDIYIYADKYRCSRILINLVENAIKYTTQGFVRIDAQDSDGVITLQVEDTGIGIPKKQQSSIFKCYTKIEQGHINSTGVGLGLHLVMRFAEQMGGKISVNSRKNKGSLFSFTFKSLNEV